MYQGFNMVGEIQFSSKLTWGILLKVNWEIFSVLKILLIFN